jgi:membrane-bound serine protease (ClpP class)
VFRVFQESWLLVLGTSTVLAGGLLAVLLWYLPYSRVASRLRLATRIGRSPFDPTVPPGGAGERVDLVGLEGVALTDLRPSGLARIGDERVDVVTLGDFIPHGTSIRVVRVAGNRVTVREIEDPAASAEAAGRLT